jgi:hypothetical protein
MVRAEVCSPMKLLCVLLLLASPAAWAGKKSEVVAEARRLSGESEKLAQKGAWSGVERTYLQLVALERKGAELSHDTHVLGAHAAQNRGDPLTTWDRLKAALDVEMRMETLTWKADLEATYSRFEVEVAPGYQGSLEVKALEPLFDPVHQQVLAAFQATLEEQRYAEVLLPLGRYQLGDQLVLESYGGETQKVSVRSRGAVVADPTITDLSLIGSSSAAAPTTQATRLAIQVGTAVDAATWETMGPRVQRLVEGVDGVGSVTLVAPPEPWHFVSFDAESLRSVGTEPEQLVASLRQRFRLTDAQLVITPNQIGVDAAAAKDLREVGLVEVDLAGAPIPINALARLRTGPKPGAPPGGLELDLREGADANAVSTALTAAVQGPEYESLDLQVTADAQSP